MSKGQDNSGELDDWRQVLSTKERERWELELQTFGVQHACHHRPIAVVTSGGTVADLETNSVRCLDNFSTGLRGAISVEQFLKRGYAVIHLRRIGSASPYGRLVHRAIQPTSNSAHYGISCTDVGKLFVAGDPEEDQEDQLVASVLNDHNQNNDQTSQDPWLTEPEQNNTGNNNSNSNNENNNNGGNKRNSSNNNDSKGPLQLHRRILNSSPLQTGLQERKAALQERRLLTVPFRSVEEYLAKLELCAKAVQDSQALAIFYLAAAVSDFYIPPSKRSQHKINSSSDGGGGGEGLTLQLYPVPKVMGTLRNEWAPDAFVCSFKLETNPDVLRQKAERAVQKYGCHMVIGNLLHSRHDQVSILAPDSFDEYNLNTDNSESSTRVMDVKKWKMHVVKRPKGCTEQEALEGLILEFVIQAHFEYISSSCNNSSALDKSGTRAVVRAHYELKEKKHRLNREIFWKQVQTTAMEWGGVAIGAVLSYAISAALRKRMNV